MTTEKRGSEKLLNSEHGLSSLTAEELAKVAGGLDPKTLLQSLGYYPSINNFPNGTPNPFLLSELSNQNIPDTLRNR